MRGVSFVPLAPEHIDEIMAIEAESNESPWSRKAFEQEVGHRLGVFLVALTGKKVVGYAGAWIVADECHITTIAVSPDERKKGLGARLMTEVLARSKEKGAACATLEVRAGNVAAIALYRSLGFAEAGLRRKYYPNNDEDAVIMWRNDLEGVA